MIFIIINKKPDGTEIQEFHPDYDRILEKTEYESVLTDPHSTNGILGTPYYEEDTTGIPLQLYFSTLTDILLPSWQETYTSYPYLYESAFSTMETTDETCPVYLHDQYLTDQWNLQQIMLFFLPVEDRSLPPVPILLMTLERNLPYPLLGDQEYSNQICYVLLIMA